MNWRPWAGGALLLGAGCLGYWWRGDAPVHTSDAAVYGALAARWEAEASALRTKLDHLPQDPGPRPVSPHASPAVVAGELRDLGLLHPLGLNLQDASTVLTWGREAQRVEPLVARLGAFTALAQAQGREISALQSQAAASYRWSASALVGYDLHEHRRVYGGMVTRNAGPLRVHAGAIGNIAFAGVGIRF